uniref:Molybdenum cofactor sulfurase n=1 Tax=Castor canadensis TaxID=51338 RepID=A0A8C0W1U8_CASCN
LCFMFCVFARLWFKFPLSLWDFLRGEQCFIKQQREASNAPSAYNEPFITYHKTNVDCVSRNLTLFPSSRDCRFEDGTIPFLDVIALKHGFDTLEHLTGGMENVRQHTFTLAQYTYAALSSLRYPNGAPVVRIYSDSEFSSPDVQGPIINLNVLEASGNVIGYSQVDKMASLYNIHLRTGCFCNTGACQRHLGISDEMVKKHFQVGHVCGDSIDIIDGHTTGSVRISFGFMSTLEDAQAFLRFIIVTFLHSPGGQSVPQEGFHTDPKVWNNSHLATNTVDLHPPLSEASSTQLSPPEKAAGVLPEDLGPYVVTKLYLYPIKSCAAFEVTKWPVGNRGLLYDRSWMVVNHNGICLNQKQEPRLCLIQPFIDLQQRIMVIKAKGMEPIELPLEEDGERAQICQSKVCADRVNTYDCGEKISNWLSAFFGRPCHLIKQSSNFQRNAKKKHGKGITFGMGRNSIPSSKEVTTPTFPSPILLFPIQSTTPSTAELYCMLDSHKSNPLFLLLPNFLNHYANWTSF